MTLTTEAASTVLQRFARGWAAPAPDAWDDLLSPDARLVQPMLPDAAGRAEIHDVFRRLLYLVPDLHGAVKSSAQEGDSMFIELELEGAVGGRPLRWTVVDILKIEGDRVVARRSCFDPTEPAFALLTRPAAWYRWWRSGIGPFASRSRLPGLRHLPA